MQPNNNNNSAQLHTFPFHNKVVSSRLYAMHEPELQAEAVDWFRGLLGRVGALRLMRPIATDVAWFVCLCVCLSPTKTDEPIKVLLGVQTRVDPRN